MDRFDRVIRDIQQKTVEKSVDWKIVQPSAFERILLNPDRTIRTSTADYELALRKFHLLFVERKMFYGEQYLDGAEGFEYQLLILGQDREIVLSLYEGVVEREDLLKLAGLIDDHNDRTKEFFDAFEKAEVA